MRYIGIDPGKGGGIAILEADGSIVHACQMPGTNAGILYVLQTHGSPECMAALEFVRSSPQMGVVSAFTFGRGFGALEMALTALQIPYRDVLPRTWQDVMQCRSGGVKTVTKARALKRWPRWKVTHAIADALLLAEYCRRTNQALAARTVQIRQKATPVRKQRKQIGDTNG